MHWLMLVKNLVFLRVRASCVSAAPGLSLVLRADLTGDVHKPTAHALCCDSSNQEFCGEPAAAGRGRKLDAQKLCLHSGHGARFACGVRGGVDGLILGVDVGHGALQNYADGCRRRPKNCLPAHSRAGIGLAGVAGKRKLAARLGAAGKRLVVETKAHVTGHERTRGNRGVVTWHLGSLGCVTCLRASETELVLQMLFRQNSIGNRWCKDTSAPASVAAQNSSRRM